MAAKVSSKKGQAQGRGGPPPPKEDAPKKGKNKTNAKKRINLKKPKARVLRVLKKRAPKIMENTKVALLVKGTKTSETTSEALKDLAKLLKPNCKAFTRRNEIRPFEDITSLEFLMQKNDCSLFAFISNSKKRPDNLVMGRTYDGHILDMVEFGVSGFLGLDSFKGVDKKRLGTKPCMLFVGDTWEHDEKIQRVKNLLIDFFRGDDVSKISLVGLDYVTMCVAVGESVLLRHYSIKMLKSGQKAPKLSLFPMGPSLTLKMRRTQFASGDLWKTACRVPSQLRPKKVKNESTNVFGDKIGRIHVGRQDLHNMRVKRVKALRGGKKAEGAEEDEREGGEGEEMEYEEQSDSDYGEEEDGEEEGSGMEDDDDEEDEEDGDVED